MLISLDKIENNVCSGISASTHFLTTALLTACFSFISQHVLVLCNAIGTPLDSKYIEIGESS